jgi:hypothetical protein
MIEDHVKKGLDFLETTSNNGFYECCISSARDKESLVISPKEIGTSLLVLGTGLKFFNWKSLTKKSINYINSQLEEGIAHFFEDEKLLPSDTDTTSWALSTLVKLNQTPDYDIRNIANKIVSNVNKNGLINIYFNPDKTSRENRVDYVALANILHFVNLCKKRDETKISEEFVFEKLKSQDYLEGSRYYHSPETFLYFTSRLLEFSEFRSKFGDLLYEETKSRIGTTDFPLDLAMRVTIMNRLHSKNKDELDKLISLQEPSGSWPTDSIYRYGSKDGYFTSKNISTAFAIESLMSK